MNPPALQALRASLQRHEGVSGGRAVTHSWLCVCKRASWSTTVQLHASGLVTAAAALSHRHVARAASQEGLQREMVQGGQLTVRGGGVRHAHDGLKKQSS